MLDHMTNTELVEKVISDAGANAQELELAMRLQAATEELERVEQSLLRAQALLNQVEAADGAHT